MCRTSARSLSWSRVSQVARLRWRLPARLDSPRILSRWRARRLVATTSTLSVSCVRLRVTVVTGRRSVTAYARPTVRLRSWSQVTSSSLPASRRSARRLSPRQKRRHRSSLPMLTARLRIPSVQSRRHRQRRNLPVWHAASWMSSRPLWIRASHRSTAIRWSRRWRS